ncbi:MAG: ATP-dependent 6-phosphofructokinase [Oscillatoriales cyanobacterium]|nr:MAG: ATP-dependent 6-phosphofructokinase [Oscillatoriales cyanobacterium]
MGEVKRIGVLTSGGDCAGLNAAIRAVVMQAANYGWEVMGIHHGTEGLMRQPPEAKLLVPDKVEQWLTLGGTLLGTINRGLPLDLPLDDGTIRDRRLDFIAGCRELGLSAIIGIGGDGSLKILHGLTDQVGMPFVGIPKTIDNDVAITEQSIGFDTAVNIATEALDRLHFTAASHDRVMILEVMGRDAGHIALHAGIAGGAHVILIPEIPYQIDLVSKAILARQAAGKAFSVVIVSEAVCTSGGDIITQTQAFGECRLGGIGQYLAQELTRATGAETRVTVLGHVQRGGVPSPLDRVLASAFGVEAVNLVARGEFSRVVTWQQRQVVSVPIEAITASCRTVDPEDTLLKTARGLGICLGDC